MFDLFLFLELGLGGGDRFSSLCGDPSKKDVDGNTTDFCAVTIGTFLRFLGFIFIFEDGLSKSSNKAKEFLGFAFGFATELNLFTIVFLTGTFGTGNSFSFGISNGSSIILIEQGNS